MEKMQNNEVKSFDSNEMNLPLIEAYSYKSECVVPISEVNKRRRIKNSKKYSSNEKEDIKEITSCMACYKNILQTYFNQKYLFNRIPILKWLPSYRMSYLIRDFIAGITVGLTAIPQGIAYSYVAGTETQNGLYTVIMPCFIYIIFGSCKDVHIGPSAIMSLMTYPYTSQYGAAHAVFLCFFSGIITLFLSFLQLGSLIDFISLPVTTGFTAAAALTIASAQIKNFFGLKSNATGILHSWISVYKNFNEISWPDTFLGCISILGLLFGRYIKYKSTQLKCNNFSQKIFSNSLWLIGLSGNFLVIVFTSWIAYFLSKSYKAQLSIMGNVPAGLPTVSMPDFSKGNTTLLEAVHHFGFSTLSVPLIAILEMITVGKAFEKGRGVDATQEMIALGLSNLAGSFIGSMPAAGSFTRTAINNSSNAKTPLGNLFTALLTIMALSFLTSTFYYIPKATLASLIITAMVFMVEYHRIPLIWKTKKSDFIPLSFSFFSCLFFGIEYGMMLGLMTNICLILYGIARPRIKVLLLNICNEHVLYVIPKQDLLFPAVSHFREIIIKNSNAYDKLYPVIIDGSHIHSIDSTTAKGIESLTEDFKARGQPLYFWKWNKLPIRSSLNYNQSLQQYFRYDDSLTQLLSMHNVANGQGENSDSKVDEAC